MPLFLLVKKSNKKLFFFTSIQILNTGQLSCIENKNKNIDSTVEYRYSYYITINYKLPVGRDTVGHLACGDPQ